MIINLNSPPRNNEHLRGSLYAGAIYRVAACDGSLRLLEAAQRLVETEAIFDSVQTLKAEDWPQWLDAVRRLKKAVFESESIRALVVALMQELGFDLCHALFETARLRVLPHADKVRPEELNGPVYGPHRDTWYANSQSQINWWMPLHDVCEQQTFVFYPEYFSKPIENSSAEFYYDEWVEKVGFGNSQSGGSAFYPLPCDGRPKAAEVLEFSASKGDIILFSASHLHATQLNQAKATRFSIDFRYVNTADELERLGAPNVDNSSTGCATRHYLSPYDALLQRPAGQRACQLY